MAKSPYRLERSCVWKLYILSNSLSPVAQDSKKKKTSGWFETVCCWWRWVTVVVAVGRCCRPIPGGFVFVSS
jgi:hypothetical protein